jgi:hypothetical protein
MKIRKKNNRSSLRIKKSRKKRKDGSSRKRKKSSSSKKSPSSSSKTINIFLKFNVTIYVSINPNMTLKELIEIVLDKFPILQKIDLFRIYFISSHKNLYFSETNQNDSLKSFNYFYNDFSYDIKIHHKEKKETENNFTILQELFSFLEERNATCKVIVSLFSSNITDSVYKNLIQQFQYRHIDNDKCIFYVLIDENFGNKRHEYHEFYDLINTEELEITSNEIDSSLDLSIIRKFKLKKPYIIDNKYSEYNKLFEIEVVPKIINSKIIIFYVLNLHITDEIMNFIKEYDNEFEIYSFSGYKMFE